MKIVYLFLCSSMHCFEGPDWQYLKRGRESFPRGPIVKTDPQGRCAGVLIYGLQLVMLKSAQVQHFPLCLFTNCFSKFQVSNLKLLD